MEYDFQVKISRAGFYGFELSALRKHRRRCVFWAIVFALGSVIILLISAKPEGSDVLFGVPFYEMMTLFLLIFIPTLLAIRLTGLIQRGYAGRPWQTPRETIFSTDYHLDESGIRSQGDHRSGQAGWEAISAAIREGNCLKLVVEPIGITVLPLDQVPPEAQAFIEQQVAAHGGKVSQ